MSVIGIDLGTTNSVVAVYRKGVAQTVPIFGRRKTPSVVSWDPQNGDMFVGNEAKKRVLIHPETSIVSNKRYMGDREKQYDILNRTYSPVDISAFLLQHLVSGASEYLGESVAKAVVTVPAYFSNNQKEDTKRAAEQAGLEALMLQAEPTAAAIAYGFEKGKNQTILVYDLGGGTFDVSLLEIRGNQFLVRGIGGDSFLGGDNFDDALMDHVSKEILGSFGVDIREDPSMEARKARQQLKELCEACKIELSESRRTEVSLPDLMGRGPFESVVTAKRLREIIAPYLDRTINITRETIAAAGMEPDDIGRVICVGGSTKLPMVYQALSDAIRKPFNAPNVDEIVAHGAAITAMGLCLPEERRDHAFPIDFGSTNVTPHNLGIRVGDDKFSVIIPRFANLPVEATKPFTTTKDYADQTDVVVFQGEQETCSNNIQLGGFLFKGFAKAPAGRPRIQVTFRLDENDILEVNASDEENRAQGSIRIEKFKAEPYQPESKQTRRLVDLRIGVSRIGYDDVGAILTKMSIPWREIKDEDFKKPKALQEFDVLFINCLAGGNAKKNAKPLEGFVRKGGLLYASDCAEKHLNAAFSNLFKIKSNRYFSGPVESTIVDEEFAEALKKNRMTINFNTVCYYCEKVNSDKGVTYLTGNYNGRQKPILVGCPYGEGHIIYTAFHNYGSATQEEQDLLRLLVLKPLALAINSTLAELEQSI